MMINIAIDGPAGAGKSTIAKRVAKELSYIYVDTGAMYRAMALYLHRLGISAEDTEKIAESCSGAEISIEYIDGEQVVLLGGENVNPLLRTREVSEMASKSSAVPQVRTRLVQLQQELGKKQNVVMDGRDIGTVVLPDAQVKIYLTASVDVRARRRWLELKEKGEDPVLEEIAREIEERDNRDMTREVSPLRIADDAVLVDSSAMTIEEVAEYILKIVHSRV
ncbi:MAG: (d)CMP kinase [Lachnospiraceae bacterium]|nr:(d)CMP kinase [Lachnospiraceae bacterium]HAL59956.1 (d)CMP kinase [Sarcina sp.]